MSRKKKIAFFIIIKTKVKAVFRSHNSARTRLIEMFPLLCLTRWIRAVDEFVDVICNKEIRSTRLVRRVVQ